MLLRALSIFSALSAALLGDAAVAVAAAIPQDRPQTEATEVDDVVVVGTAIQRAAGVYVRTIGTGPAGRLSPRWHDRICVRVIEMDAEHAAFLRSRIETVARAVGLSPDTSPDCTPDISIYASNTPDVLARTLTEAAPRRFQPARRNVTLGDAALEQFRGSDAPVRWWHVSLPLMADTGQPAMIEDVGGTGDPLARSVAVRNGSRLAGNVRDDLMGVVVIMDPGKLADAPFGAVADYVALVALAPVDPRADTSALDTVLNLFDRTGVTGLTAMDQDYLHALYAASRAPASPSLQAAEIANRMAAERRKRLMEK